EALDARLLGRLGEAHRALQVDVVGQVGVDVAQRIVRQRGQVTDGVDALELLRADVAQIGVDAGHVVGRRAKVAGVEVAVVEADHLVPRLAQHADHLDPDVAPVPGYQNLHRVTSRKIRLRVAITAPSRSEWGR